MRKEKVEELLKKIEMEKETIFKLYDKRIGFYVKWNAFIITMEKIENLIKELVEDENEREI